MDKVNLPTEKASEPKEEARQPSALKKHHGKKQQITFHEAGRKYTSSEAKTNSFKEVLSQPASELSHRQKLMWLQKRRSVGLWAQCDNCQSWRYLPHVLDSHELPDKWYCRMNPDKELSDCSIPEVPIKVHEEEDLVHGEYGAGSLVWARLPGWPWWPALVDDCPDNEQYYWLDGFSDIPTHYNVVFFDAAEVTRAWVAPDNLRPYVANKKTFINSVNNKIKKRMEAAILQADEAAKLELNSRLAKYSFIARYNGPISNPKKISRKVLEKYQQRLEKKYNVPFPLESSDSEDDIQVAPEPKPKKNKLKNDSKGGKTKRAKNGKSYIKGKESSNVDKTTPLQQAPAVYSDDLNEKSTTNLSSPMLTVVDNISDSPLHSSNANATFDASTDEIRHIDKDITPAPNVLIPETESQTEIINSDIDSGNRMLVSPSSGDFEF